MSDLTTRTNCDACGGELTDVFDLGNQPLANALVEPDSPPATTYPLTLAECQSCRLVQLRHVVSPAVLYQGYRFWTGASQPNHAYFAGLAEWIWKRAAGLRCLEIGSNDGTLLAELERKGFNVTGVDPAEEQCEQARKKIKRGHVECCYWRQDTHDHRVARYDIIVSTNVLGHSDDLPEFLRGVRRALKPSGLFVVEVQYLKTLLRESALEMCYHEHVSYFDETSLERLLARLGFEVMGWEKNYSQGGTLRMWAKLATFWRPGPGCASPPPRDWDSFRTGVETRRTAIKETVRDLRDQCRRVSFLGAPAKATVLANYCGLDSTLIDYASDTTPAKQGLMIPGANIPIVAPDQRGPTDAAIVTAWNHWEHIERTESAFMAGGGVLILPTLAGLAKPEATIR